MRKFVVAALAIPVLVTLYVPVFLRRSIAVRLVFGLGIVALLGLGVLAATSPRATTATTPTVTTPLDTASFSSTVDVGHGLHAPAILTFAKQMNPASVAAALTVEPAAPFASSWDAAGRTLTIKPQAMWQPGTFYTIKVAPAALDTTGKPLPQAARALFSTRAATVAHLALTNPVGGGASTTSGFTVSFDRAVPTPSAASLLSIEPAVTGTLTGVSTTADGTTVTFQPDQPLAPGTAYTVALQADLLDSDGASVAMPDPLQVRTVVPPGVVRFRPLSGTKNVDPSARLSVRFTQAMDVAATGAAFRASIGTKVLTGKISWAEGNTVLVFTPKSPLTRGRSVTMTVSTAAQSAAGVPLAAARSVAFKTILAPVVAKVVKAPRPKSTGGSGGSGGGATGAGAWHAVEVYYLGLMNCTRGGGWVIASGRCSSPGGSGVAPLILNAGISNKVSRPYAKFLTTRNICSHFADGNPGDRLHRNGYPGDYRENLGCYDTKNPYFSALQTEIYFQTEKPCGNYCHYANIMDPRMKQVGIGMWVIGNRIRLVIDFWHG